MDTNSFNEILNMPPSIHFASATLRKKGLSRTFFLLDHWSLIFFSCLTDVYIEKDKYELMPGAICLLPPNTSRQFDYKSEAHHRTIHFSCNIEPAKICDRLKPVIWNVGNKSFLFKKMHQEIVDNYLLKPEKAKAIFWYLLWELSDCLEAKGNSTHQEIVQLCAYIENNLSSCLSVESILDQSSFSHTHLLRLFKKTFACSITAYIRKRRMDVAKYLLLNSNMQIKAIALESGFHDLQHFNKVFRKVYGVSPRVFRASGKEFIHK